MAIASSSGGRGTLVCAACAGAKRRTRVEASFSTRISIPGSSVRALRMKVLNSVATRLPRGSSTPTHASPMAGRRAASISAARPSGVGKPTPCSTTCRMENLV